MDLVIGIGNRLRKDDGIGPALVESLRPIDGAEFHVVHQLTPDLAPRLSEIDRVLFVDAAINAAEITLEPVAPAQGHGIGHAMTPTAFLDLAAIAFDAKPPAWLLAVPGYDFGIGEGLSLEARLRLPEATRTIGMWLGTGSETARV